MPGSRRIPNPPPLRKARLFERALKNGGTGCADSGISRGFPASLPCRRRSGAMKLCDSGGFGDGGRPPRRAAVFRALGNAGNCRRSRMHPSLQFFRQALRKPLLRSRGHERPTCTTEARKDRGLALPIPSPCLLPVGAIKARPPMPAPDPPHGPGRRGPPPDARPSPTLAQCATRSQALRPPSASAPGFSGHATPFAGAGWSDIRTSPTSSA